MRRSAVGILIVVLVAAAMVFVKNTREVPSVKVSRQRRVMTPEQLLTRIHRLDEPLRLRTAVDVLPGGYTAAMAPLMIEWDASRPFAEDGFVIIHNVNHGGNPVDGTTVFCSARVPLDGVEAVEFILLPLDKLGKEGLVQHGQMRFIFSDANPVELLNFGNDEMGSDRHLKDLVISWEAWRPPDVDYDVRTGMNPAAYLLSPRIFSGPTRFLDDGLGHRDWFAYRLRLPGGKRGLAELLKTNLALCDGVARHTVSNILGQGEEEWVRQAPRQEGKQAEVQADWEELRQVVAPRSVTSDPLLNLPEKDLAYQTILRSCATMALYTINVAVERLAAQGLDDGLDPEHRMLPELGHQEEWMTDLASTDLKGIFLRAPTILRYLRDNPQAFPKRIPHQLERAGLLEMTGGKPRKLHYSLDGTTPYGSLAENLVP